MDAVKADAQKNRALKKYEAAPVAVATEPGDPFGGHAVFGKAPGPVSERILRHRE